MSVITMFRKVISLVVVALLLEIPNSRGNTLFGKYIEETPFGISPMTNDKFLPHIHSMLNAYREDNEKVVLETNNFLDTKYKTWKRNGDLINSLLALPKDMDAAGR